MKRLLFLSAVILFLVANVQAAPWVICNDYPTSGGVPDYFNVVVDGAPVPLQSPAFTVSNTDCKFPNQPWDCCTGLGVGTCSGVILHYDVSSLALGTHTLSAQACNTTTPTVAGGCTSIVNFTFAVKIPGTGQTGTAPVATRVSGQ